MLTLAACLSEGGSLFGRYPTYANGSIVYIQADMTDAIEQERVRRAKLYYPLSNVYFHFPSFLNVASLQPTHQLVQEIRAVAPTVIIWDTLRKIHRGDSNADGTSSYIYGTAKDLFPTATHFFVHHDKKTIVDQEQLDDDETFRGSGAWLDDCDTGIRLRRAAQGRLILQFTKIRTAPEQPPIPLALNYETLLLYASGDQADALMKTWKAAHPSATPEEAARYLRSSFIGSPRIAQYISERPASTALSIP